MSVSKNVSQDPSQDAFFMHIGFHVSPLPVPPPVFLFRSERVVSFCCAFFIAVFATQNQPFFLSFISGFPRPFLTPDNERVSGSLAVCIPTHTPIVLQSLNPVPSFY